MLQEQAVEKSTLELIKNLQEKAYLHGFYLVGGTALAISINHRKSIDIDLFSNFNFDTQQIIESLNVDYDFNLFHSGINTIKGSISNIKVDIIAHRYPYVGNVKIINNISLVSTEDIIAMKLNAITTSGQRVKYFIDIYCLLEKYNIEEMLDFYKKKYSHQNEVNVLKSLLWFNDVDLSEWPIMIKNKNLKWVVVKREITKSVKNYL